LRLKSFFVYKFNWHSKEFPIRWSALVAADVWIWSRTFCLKVIGIISCFLSTCWACAATFYFSSRSRWKIRWIEKFLKIYASEIICQPPKCRKSSILTHPNQWNDLSTAKITIKLDYNDHGYNKFTSITNIIMLDCLSQATSYNLNHHSNYV